uniref:Histone H1.8 n=1 Tax=Nannospalax galili TaxID=1026970 RepID=A0A8C6WDB0_NANGA
MAPGSIASVSSSSSSSPSTDTSPSGSSVSLRTDKPGPRYSDVRVGRRNPTMLRMVLEAMQARERRQGTSVVAIKIYILHKYPTVDATRFKYLLKRALDTGMSRGLLARPANSKAKGATGSFKLVPKHKRKKTGSRGSTGAKRTDPQKPGRPKRDHTSEAKVEKVALKPGHGSKAYPCPGATLEKAPKKGSEAKPEEARKAPLKSTKAVWTPVSTSGLSQKSKVKYSANRQGAAETHGKTKAVGKKSKPMASKVQNGVASPTKRKMAARVLNKTVVQGAETGPKTKAPAPPRGTGLKAQPTYRKTRTPESPKAF